MARITSIIIYCSRCGASDTNNHEMDPGYHMGILKLETNSEQVYSFFTRLLAGSASAASRATLFAAAAVRGTCATCQQQTQISIACQEEPRLERTASANLQGYS
jgi:hypothetical protein